MAMNLPDYCNAERGRANKLARALSVSPMTVGDWKRGKKEVPIARCAQIEAATEGLVTRKILRPNDWQQIWPELS